MIRLKIKKENTDVKGDKKEDKVTENIEDTNDSPLRPPRPKSQASKPADDTESHRHSILKMVQQQQQQQQSPVQSPPTAVKPKPAPRSVGQRTPSQSSMESSVESQNHNKTPNGDGKPKPAPPVKPRPPVAQKPGRNSFNKNTDGEDVQTHDTPSEVKENGNDKSEVVVDSATLRLNVKDKIKKLAGDINMNSEQVPPIGFRKKNSSLPREKNTGSDLDDRTSRPQSMFVGIPSNSDVGPVSNKLSKTKSDVNIASSSDDKTTENKDNSESKADSSAKDPIEKEEETTKENKENKENSVKDDEVIMV